MASVHSNATRQYVEELVKTAGLNYVWFGGNDIDEEGVWKWTDCSPAWDFNFWSPGNPSNGAGIQDQDCLVYHDGEWKWDDIDCAVKFAFVCSKYICPT